MTPQSNEEFQELAIAHLLGELDAGGEAAFEAELSRRGGAGREVLRMLEETLGVVALAASSAEPPPSLRGRVLASVGDAPQPRIVTVRRAPPWLWAAAAVLAALSIGLGVWAARLASERSQLREARGKVIEAWAADADSARTRFADLEDDLEFVGGPASDLQALAGTGAYAQAGGRVFLDRANGRAIFFAYRLPAVAVDRVYELWAIGPEGPRRAGVFRPDDRGRARLEIEDPDLLRSVQALAVTTEPAPGVDQPTGEIVLSSGGA